MFLLAELRLFLAAVAELAYFGQKGALGEEQPTTALAWLHQVIARTGTAGIRIAQLGGADRREDDRDFYVPGLSTIVLSQDVLRGNSIHAHAVAAHELGHALAGRDFPRLETLDRFARSYQHTLFTVGVGLVLAAALVGGSGLGLAGLALILLAVVAALVILANEVLASVVGARLLREHLQTPTSSHRRILGGAAATYAAGAISMLVVALAFAWLAPWKDANVVPPLPAPVLASGWHTAVAGIIAVAPLLVAATLLQLAWTRSRGVALGAMTLLVLVTAFFLAPILLVDIVASPDVPRWAFALALAACWTLFVTPLSGVMNWFRRWSTRHMREMRAILPPEETSIPTLSLRDVAASGSVTPYLVWAGRVFLLVPLAVWWLFFR